MALLTVAVAGLTLGSFLLFKSRAGQAQVQVQRDAMLKIQQAVQGFAYAQGRLPCPASIRLGAEDCAAGTRAKGWLPVATLIDSGGDAQALLPSGMAVRYLVDRGSGAPARDLAAAGGVFHPALASSASAAAYPPALASTLDLCARLALAGEPAASEAAYAMAIAAPGATDEASGLNADFSRPGLEPAQRPTDAGYTDLVIVVTPAALYEAAGCEPTTASVDAMAMAAAWVDDANAMRASNIAKADNGVLTNSLGTAADALYMVDSLADLQNAVYNAGDNAAKAVIAAKTPPLWPYVPVHVGGIGKALGGLLISVVDVSRNAITVALRGMHAAAYAQMARNAAAQPVWQGALQMVARSHAAGMAASLPALPLAEPFEP
ncbi:hypothetical protein [Hydrogenophaga sp.]|uniref:hypothetical protein n=1 Tax=Hydrogenophaga sp. TaxID=1904254 RepID=UPI0026021982|nr:hypothetical protein [Hydrogenophaga sp.]MCW5652375.1 hypothetical protein [Hydrogenophaga sp.]